MGDSPDVDAMKRAVRHIQEQDPNAVTRREQARALQDAGFNEQSIAAFLNRMPDLDSVVEDVPDDPIITREQVDEIAGNQQLEGRDGTTDVPSDAQDALTDAAAQEVGAPSESDLRAARAQAAQNLDGDVVRSDPDLDPLAGDEGREIGTVSDVTSATGGRGGGMTETVEKTGESTATLYYEDSGGERYPVAEVDI